MLNYMKPITNSMISKGIMFTIAIGVFLVGLGVGFGVFASSSSSSDKQIEDQNANIAALELGLKSTNEKIGALQETVNMMMEKMDTMMEGMDMMMGMMMGDMMGPMDGMQGDTMEDMMNQEPQDVRIELKSGHGKVPVGKETEIVLLVLDKETQEPLEGLEVLIHIERGSSMSSMEMMGDMFPAEDKGSGEYVVRFTPDSEGVYTVHTMVMLPRKSMMDNHMDFSIIAE